MASRRGPLVETMAAGERVEVAGEVVMLVVVAWVAALPEAAALEAVATAAVAMEMANVVAEPARGRRRKHDICTGSSC